MKVFCNNCQKLNDTWISIKFVKAQPDTFKNLNDKRNQKWNFMLRADCAECEKFIKFLPQTDDTIAMLQDNSLLPKA